MQVYATAAPPALLKCGMPAEDWCRWAAGLTQLTSTLAGPAGCRALPRHDRRRRAALHQHARGGSCPPRAPAARRGCAPPPGALRPARAQVTAARPSAGILARGGARATGGALGPLHLAPRGQTGPRQRPPQRPPAAAAAQRASAARPPDGRAATPSDGMAPLRRRGPRARLPRSACSTRDRSPSAPQCSRRARRSARRTSARSTRVTARAQVAAVAAAASRWRMSSARSRC